jgi:DNA-binding MarR family transcriptional regulator
VQVDSKPPSRGRSPQGDPPAARPGSEQVGPHPAELIAAERFLHRRLRNRLNDATDGHGLSYAQVEVMLLLEERTNLHAGQMARALGTSRQAVHALLEKLEGAGLVDVLPQQGEARPVALTDLGRRRIRSIWGVLDSTVHAALRQIPAGERRKLLDALNRCERALAPIRPPWWLD